MENKRVRIKYHQRYDPALNEKLTAVAVALCGEFNDRPLGDDAREMSFEFGKDENLRKFFRIFQGLLAEKDENGEDVNNQKVGQCEEAIQEVLPLIERARDEGRDRRALVEALVGLESRKVKLGLMQRLGAARTLNKCEPAPERNDRGDRQYGDDFRRFITPKALGDKDFQLGLNDGDRMAELLEPMIAGSVAVFDVSSAPPDLRPALEQTAERLIFFGLRTHCICFCSPYRFRYDDIVSLERLYGDWNIKSLTAFSQLRGYNEGNRGIPRLIFDTVFDSEVEPIQKRLTMGWWRRMKNRAKFVNLFWEGVLLGVMYDMKAKELADKETAQSAGAQHSTQTMPELKDEDIPF
jgi:hypothetical protein